MAVRTSCYRGDARKIAEHKLSEYIDDDEKSRLKRWLGDDKKCVSCGVSQLLGVDQQDGRWTKLGTGFVCLVKDFSRQQKCTYAIQFFREDGEDLLYEKLFIVVGECSSFEERLIQFEGKTAVYGLNFAKLDEAREFKLKLKQVEDRRRNQQKQQGRTSSVVAIQNNNQMMTTTMTTNYATAASTTTKRGKSSRSQKKKLTKSDIGLPQNPLHLTHVELDGQKCFVKDEAISDQKLDPKIRFMLESIGYPADQLSKREQREVCQFIQEHGGVDNLPAVRDTETFRPPSSRTAPGRASLSSPSLLNQPWAAPPPPFDPGYATFAADRRPSSRMPGHPSGPAPPPPPPPPPPPLLASSNLVDPATTMDQPMVTVDNGRRNLLADIQRGKQLRSVGEVPKASTVGASGGSAMQQALLKILAERRKCQDDSGSEDEDEEDKDDEDNTSISEDEWDD